MANRFKNPWMRKNYDACVAAFHDKDSEFYHNGEPRRGASHRCAFWSGYNGDPAGANAIPGTLSWACYRAGQDCAKEGRV